MMLLVRVDFADPAKVQSDRDAKVLGFSTIAKALDFSANLDFSTQVSGPPSRTEAPAARPAHRPGAPCRDCHGPSRPAELERSGGWPWLPGVAAPVSESHRPAR